jgi:superfamily I DNA and/or RNA helicase/very-short-patch-repair endonuclease
MEKLNTKQNDFIIEVAKYFMNFLETDFKKRSIPKRTSNQTSKDWLLVWLNLDKYPNFKDILLKNLNTWFQKEELIIKKWNFIINIPSNLSTLINLKIEEINQENLDIFFNEVVKKIIENKKIYKEEYDKYEEESLEEIKNNFLELFIVPLINDLEKPLENLDLSNENTKFELQIEILEFIFVNIEIILKEILLNFFNKEENLKEILKEVFILENIKQNLIEFFDNFSIRDLFYDIYEIYKNSSLIDKSELYFYFYEISFGNNKFPLFYTNLWVKFDNDIVKIELDKKLYLNTKWLDFIVQEYNRLLNSTSTLNWEFERIFYINQIEDFNNLINSILIKIQNFFSLKWNLDTSKSDIQRLINQNIWLSNKIYFFLADKWDESLINDYEEIIAWENLELLENFSELLESFIKENPKSFINEVDIEWDNYNIEQKLIYQSPIPLNEEQKQVINALNRSDCKFLILEWPPWTWKSHTITSIICKALLEEKSVLVLSDKKEALDVVEDKITHTLNKIRYNQEDFQNPILRLWKTWNKFWKIIQSQSLAKIKEHARSFRKIKENFENNKNNIIEDLKWNLIENIEHFQNISLKDIEFYFSSLDKFRNIDFITNDEDLILREDFLNIKTYLEEIRGKNKENIDLNNVSQEYLDSMLELQDILLQVQKNKRNIKTLEQVYDYILSLSNEKIDFLDKIYEDLIKYKNFISNLLDYKVLLKNYDNNDYNLELFFNDIIRLKSNIYISEEALKYFENQNNKINFLSNFIPNNDLDLSSILESLKSYVNKIKDLKNPIFWYLLKQDKVNEINRDFKKKFNNLNINKPQNELDLILDIINLFEFIIEKISKENWNTFDFTSIIKILTKQDLKENILKDIQMILDSKGNYEKYLMLNIFWNDHYEWLNLVINTNNLSKIVDDFNINYILENELNSKIENVNNLIINIQDLLVLKEKINYLYDFFNNNSIISNKIDLNLNKITSKLDNYTNDFIDEYFNFKKIEYKIIKDFNNLPDDIYWEYIWNLEDTITAEMANFIDERLIDYVENNANEVNTLKNIISNQLKFPKDLFLNLKKAFPCIIAWIRDYANYIPLEKDLFDLIVIDEASQVSIAQALPAFIRWKQIIILWDDKQFSNVKSWLAKKEINYEYKSRIKNTFSNDYIVWEDTLWLLAKVDKNFDIKNSVLKFTKFIRNYELQLKKHFRWYPEIISYSNKYFYSNSLQCMKIRWQKIEETIKFDLIEHDWLIDKSKNINELEANFIIDKLQEIKEKWIKQSVWIISPHREQVSYLFSKINSLKDRDYFFDDLELKIMTFDTCQWEERDYIFYSMVATDQVDKLQWIFPKSLTQLEDEIEWTLKAQRLNVWFSRAKETIHFVLSKPIEDFKWEIKIALLHFQNELENWKKKIVWWTDINSPMEEKIQHYFYETNFYKNNKDKIEFIPQFPIWEYLKQLDKTYNHASYKVDFLLIFDKQKIIIEYDWFKEHFSNLSQVDKYNYEYYMKEDDIYRQKILEWYWYKFLRINIFNIWKEPIETLNNRLEELTKKKIEKLSIVSDLHNQIDKLHNWDDRTCDNCLNIFSSNFFPYKTKNLCLNCYEKVNKKILHTFRNNLKNTNSNEYVENNITNSSDVCPYCNSKNIWSKWYRWGTKRLVCRNCSKSWSVPITAYIKKPENKISYTKNEEDFIREDSLEDIKKYLNNKKNNNLPVSFYYKNKNSIDEYNNYYFDDRYLYVKSWYSKFYIKYLIDKIRKVV